MLREQIKRGRFCLIRPLWKFVWSLRLFAEVDADVEPAVIPVRLVIAAPTAVGVHTLYIAVHLPAVLAIPGRILIDPDPIRFEPAAATFAPVPIRPSRSPHGQQQTSGHRCSQSHSNP